MKQKLIEILETFCPDDVYLQGTLNPESPYPQKFITFYTMDSEFDSFYDNDANKIDWYIHVVFYSSNPAEVLNTPPQIIRALKAAGFIPINAGIDIPSDVVTHTGWAMEFIYPQKYTN